MKINKNLITILAISTLCIGCKNNNLSSPFNENSLNSTNSTISNKNNNYAKIKITNENKNGDVISPENVNIKDTLYSFESKKLHNLQVLPSIGNVNILVIPILLPDFQTIDINEDGIDDKEKVREDINKAFFSESNEKYESVKTYYQKSSFGKLNLSGTVTEWFDVAEYTNYTSAAEIDYYETYDVVKNAINWVKNIIKIDLSDYDYDSDGYIDGVWCVYSCPNYTNGGPQTDYRNYWAYTSWGNQTSDGDNEVPNINNPVYNLFGWASYDFMYDGYGNDYVDAHTFIHETGHFLGLNDYYSDQMSYNPIGKVDMMDANIIDHNSYSKMLLGWTKPYVVTGNITIDLKSMSNENSLIVIPGDSEIIENNTFDPFGEYILIEYYTNEGLNYFDSLEKYSNGFQGLKNNGVRIYHIDNRKFIVDSSNEYNITCKEYNEETIDKNHKLVLPITNNRNYDNYNYLYNLDINTNLFDEIRLIEASNVDTFSSGGIQKDKSLFKENDIFTLEKYGKNFFINNQKFNNGDTFSYQINIEEVK